MTISTNEDIKNLALALAHAESEDEAIKILKKYQLWDNEEVWQEYGDQPNNYSVMGNQQSSADTALVEKLINSVDAVLMRECHKNRLDPEGEEAPKDIPQAQKAWYGIRNGKLSSINAGERTKLAENISLVATGSKTRPNLSIIDKGEGQTPEGMPGTLLSLTGGNKVKIQFVQGKYGMGGTGALRFCSNKHKLELIISKRNTQITNKLNNEWGFTIVRKEEPRYNERSSHFTYLAPNKKVFAFDAGSLKLLPGQFPTVFENDLDSGTYIKLYEYEIGKGLASQITFDLSYRLALLVPDIALPIRMYERREEYYKAHTNEKTLAGLSVRLDEDKSNNIEEEFQTPSTGDITIHGEKLTYSIVVFKKGKEENYAKNEGVIFTVNGQAQGFLPRTFFNRKSVGMGYISDSILVIVDCSKMTRSTQEDLFMPSRDRLSSSSFEKQIEEKLSEVIKNHPGLKDLCNRRRKEAIEDKVKDSKPLADVLEKMIRNSPTLSNLFLGGVRIPNPFKEGEKEIEERYKGRKYPTFFQASKKYSEDKPKQCPENFKSYQLKYNTDAENDYFKRDIEPGELKVTIDGEETNNFSLNLWNGVALLSVKKPSRLRIGDKLCIRVEVEDISRSEPLVADTYIQITKEQISGGHRPPKPPRKSALSIPPIVHIAKEDWDKGEYKDLGFNEHAALRVKSSGEGAYDYYLNDDNIYIKNEIKNVSKIDPQVLKTRYECGMILLGISVIDFTNKYKKEFSENEVDEVSIEQKVALLTDSIAPMLLPMIAELGGLEE